MALVICPDCETRVSDSAPVCPSCGRPSPGGRSTLIITRPGRMLFASPLHVYVDSNHVGVLGVGSDTSVAVTPGVHRLKVEITPPRQKTKIVDVDVDIAGGATMTAAVTFSKMTGKPSIDFN